MQQSSAACLAVSLYPHETWERLSDHIFLAVSRKPINYNQVKVMNKELRQAAVLERAGHTVYMLPESGEEGKRFPDAVVDDLIMEFKTITGNAREIERRYKEAREKADHVFIKIDSSISRFDVRRKLALVVQSRGYQTGQIWVYFTQSDELFYWSVADFQHRPGPAESSPERQ
jgi:hypothetical protein